MHSRFAQTALLAALFFVMGTAALAQAAPEIAVVGDCEKITADAAAPRADYIWDAAAHKVTLQGAKNEVVAFQIVINSDEPLAGGDVQFKDLSGPADFSGQNFTVFLELYQSVTRQWSGTPDLPVDKEYPDPLVPLYDPYRPAGERVAVAAPFDVKPGRNTILWVDCWIPPSAAPGDYKGVASVVFGDKTVPLNIELKVWDFTVPAQSHIYNFTETYRWEFEYHEKAEYGFGKSGWDKMKRYDEILLQHRVENCLTRLWPEMKFAADGRLVSIDWSEYDKYVSSRLDGTFVSGGPAKGRRPELWYFQFAPIFPNDPDIKGKPVNWHKRGTYEETLLRSLAREVARHWREKGWTTPVVVSLLDESNDWETIRWGARIFREEGGDVFKYMNTGHYGVEAQLVGCVDIWSPNAENYDPCEMVLRKAAGDMTWFYHWSEPYIGHMVFNTYGVALRTWDAAAFKYGVDGTFLWTANNWPHPKNWRSSWGEIQSPYVVAAGANGGERWGNGTYLYPGAELPDAGFRAIDGPVSSMRLKVMRRGAQDYEYLWLLSRKGRVWDAKARAILSTVMRSALGASSQLGQTPAFEVDANLPWTKEIKPNQGDWSHDGADWEKMRAELAEAILLSEKASQ